MIVERLTLPNSVGIEVPVLRIDVPRSLVVHRSPGGYFHRVGSGKRQMSPDYLARRFRQQSQARIIRLDEQNPGGGISGQRATPDAADITGPLDFQVLDAIVL